MTVIMPFSSWSILRMPIESLKMQTLSKMKQWSCSETKSLKIAASLLQEGKIVAIPTDTIYGLAGLAQDNDSIARLYQIKKRSLQKPLAICLSDIREIENWAHTDDLPKGLIELLLPGPTTVILRRKPELNLALNPGVDNVGIRIPNSEFVRKLVKSVNQPIALTSANESNKPSSLHPIEFEELWPKIDGIFFNETKSVDDPKIWRKGSTVVDLSVKGQFQIIRIGIGSTETLKLLRNFKLREI